MPLFQKKDHSKKPGNPTPTNDPITARIDQRMKELTRSGEMAAARESKKVPDRAPQVETAAVSPGQPERTVARGLKLFRQSPQERQQTIDIGIFRQIGELTKKLQKIMADQRISKSDPAKGSKYKIEIERISADIAKLTEIAKEKDPGKRSQEYGQFLSDRMSGKTPSPEKSGGRDGI